MIYYPHISANWTDFKNTNGYDRALPDVISCVVTEERNGAYDLEMEYPYSGTNADAIEISGIIAAMTSEGTKEPFRIYSVEKNIDGILHVLAHSVIYDTDGIVLEPFTAANATQIVNALNSFTNPVDLPTFVITSNGYNAEAYDLKVDTPTSLFACLGLAADAMRGELGYHYNPTTMQYEITIYRTRGEARTAAIGYGVNLLTLQRSLNSEGVYTDVYPYYYNENDGTLVELPEKTVSTGVTAKTRILAVNLTSKFDHTPTDAELRTAANAYVTANSFVIASSTTFDFVPLASTTEYGDQGDAQTIRLCDTITVRAARIGVTVTAKVVRTEYNVLLCKYDGLTAGSIMPTIADTIAQLEKDVKK